MSAEKSAQKVRVSPSQLAMDIDPSPGPIMSAIDAQKAAQPTQTPTTAATTSTQEEERKLKAAIRGIPADFAVDDIKADPCSQRFSLHSMHRIVRCDGSPLWLVLAVLSKTDEAKQIFKNLNQVCGLSGIRV
ncbi:hypothetical protein EVAR_9252_1 [Eumeta japonica]|uniref:Uncharacterized protein n=1 Tax=Eumeta variegata TaxID=151549 RepID=A0A4C1TMI9_EUMVA|nr:hypothetical protein EVAR_9252_1 [Eumeta japonica]